MEINSYSSHTVASALNIEKGSRNRTEKASFGRNADDTEIRSATKSPCTSSAKFANEGDGCENTACRAVKVKPLSAEHQPRSRTRNWNPSGPLRAHNCKDRLPSLETEQQFRAAVTERAKGGDSMERDHPKGTVPSATSKLSQWTSESDPIISPPSHAAQVHCSAKTKEVKHRRTADEVDAFFARLSTPKYVRAPITKENKETGRYLSVISAPHRSRYEATKGLRVDVVRTRSNSIARSGSRPSSAGK